ncbi:hypothetical protein H2201_002686 [Coniosporium apollinis]|uniref:Uncharacterized protein n=1 Tax=Coniosporium apollinis TaxID=61459 RepID=A0ABQ9NZL6_9PEZI|nr:hypothetical protein H2201_002686 [Coniosporium apollinis]
MVGSPLPLFKENPLRRYSTCVELYSGRQLTLYSDKLMAFRGIDKTLGYPLAVSFLYGLPDSYFDWALLWELKSPGSFKGHEVDQAYGKFFPSWSWSGWDSGVEWRLSTISGVLLHVHEWLVTRTWIVWYKGTRGSHEWVWLRRSKAGPSHRWYGYSCGSDDDETDPYGRRRPYGRKTLNRKTEPQATPKEGCLHFWTYTAFFTLSRKSMSGAAFKSSLDPGLHRFGILDSKGDWCGTVVLDKTWLDAVGGTFEFVAISEAKDFALEECDAGRIISLKSEIKRSGIFTMHS